MKTTDKSLENTCIIYTPANSIQVEKAEILLSSIGIPTATLLQLKTQELNDYKKVKGMKTIFIPKDLNVPSTLLSNKNTNIIFYDNLFDQIPELVSEYQEASSLGDVKAIIEKNNIVEMLCPTINLTVRSIPNYIDIIKRSVEYIVENLEKQINTTNEKSKKWYQLKFAYYYLQVKMAKIIDKNISIEICLDKKIPWNDIEEVLREHISILFDEINPYSVYLLEADIASQDIMYEVLAQKFYIGASRITSSDLLIAKTYDEISMFKKRHMELFESDFFLNEAIRKGGVTLERIHKSSVIKRQIIPDDGTPTQAQRNKFVTIMEDLYTMSKILEDIETNTDYKNLSLNWLNCLYRYTWLYIYNLKAILEGDCQSIDYKMSEGFTNIIAEIKERTKKYQKLF